MARSSVTSTRWLIWARRRSAAWNWGLLRVTRWHIRLWRTSRSRWLQNKSTILAWTVLAWPGQNGTFVLKSRGGSSQPDVSPCISISFIESIIINLNNWLIRVAWPTEDESGRAVSALDGVPFVRYKGATADYTDECEIKVRNQRALQCQA